MLKRMAKNDGTFIFSKTMTRNRKTLIPLKKMGKIGTLNSG